LLNFANFFSKQAVFVIRNFEQIILKRCLTDAREMFYDITKKLRWQVDGKLFLNNY
jgi:hypothetical protein